MQTIDLVDKISEAVDKINENFTSVDSNLNQVSFGGVDSSSVITIIDGHLDSAYFTSTINEGYLNQFTISQSVDLTDVTNNINANASAISQLTTRVDQDSNALSILSSDVTTLQGQFSGSVQVDSDLVISVLAGSQAFESLETRIDADSDRLTVESGKIINLETSLFTTDSNGNPTTAIAEAVDSLTTTISNVQGQITTNATWNLQLVAGTEADPRFAGIQFSNDGQSADFTLSADKFKIVDPTSPTGSPIVPFSVDTDGATLTNVKITGNLDIGSDLTGARMEIKDDVTKIFDTNGQLRVQLGNLSV